MTIRYDKEVNAFVGFCPKTKIFSQGRTRKEAIKATKDAIRLFIKCKKRIKMV